MAYKVNSTTVIDNNGNVDWARISNKPTIGSGDITNVSVANSGIGNCVYFASQGYERGVTNYPNGGGQGNCNCVVNCYVESLQGGASSGSATITSNRKRYNCNCNCNCRC